MCKTKHRKADNPTATNSLSLSLPQVIITKCSLTQVYFKKYL